MLQASQADRWMNCALSAQQEPDRPEQQGDAAREGTCAAWVAEMVIEGDAGSAEDMLNKTHENGWQVDPDMVRHVDTYLRVVNQFGTRAEQDYGNSAATCRIDAMRYDQDRDLLYIWDFKYGYGHVDVRENWQLLVEFFLTGIRPEMVQLAIVQPRGLHKGGAYRKWVLSKAEYTPYLDRIAARIEELTAGASDAVPGPHCKSCPLAAGCEALSDTVYRMMDEVATSRVYETPSPQQLADELDWLTSFETMFKARLGAVQAEAEARLKTGGFVPGYVLEQRHGKRAFTVGADAIRMLTGIDPTDPKLCTPAELIRRGADEKVVENITRTPFIGTKLARIDPEDVLAQFQKVKGHTK